MADKLTAQRFYCTFTARRDKNPHSQNVLLLFAIRRFWQLGNGKRQCFQTYTVNSHFAITQFSVIISIWFVFRETKSCYAGASPLANTEMPHFFVIFALSHAMIYHFVAEENVQRTSSAPYTTPNAVASFVARKAPALNCFYCRLLLLTDGHGWIPIENADHDNDYAAMIADISGGASSTRLNRFKMS